MSATATLLDTIANDVRYRDAALQVCDAIECLSAPDVHDVCHPLRWNAAMITVAVLEGIRAAKDGRLPISGPLWHDSMCQLACDIRAIVSAK